MKFLFKILSLLPLFLAVANAIPAVRQIKIPNDFKNLNSRPKINVKQPIGQQLNVNEDLGTLIIGGTDAAPHSHPYTVLIILSDGQDYYLRCSGIAYDSNYVITSSRCIGNEPAANFMIIGGEHNYNTDEGNEQFRNVESYQMHPQFDPEILTNDVAVIKLETPFRFGQYLQPIRLGESEPSTGETCVLSGWGSLDTQGTVFPETLQEIDLNIVDRETCGSVMPGISNGNICAGYPPNFNGGSCYADEGGPLVCENSNGVKYLAGIASWHGCTTTIFPYDVLSNVAHFRDWIRATMN